MAEILGNSAGFIVRVKALKTASFSLTICPAVHRNLPFSAAAIVLHAVDSGREPWPAACTHIP